MTKRLVVELGVVGLVVIAGLAIARPNTPEVKPAGGGDGRFAVSPMGDTAVLVDVTTGRAWVYYPAADPGFGAWLPTQRIDDPNEAAKYLDLQKHLQARKKPEEGREGSRRPRVAGQGFLADMPYQTLQQTGGGM